MELEENVAAQATVFLRSRHGMSGTGFLVQESRVVFIVTAEHVARTLDWTSLVALSGAAGDARALTLSRVSGNDPVVWVNHQTADVAVMPVLGTAAAVSAFRERALTTAHLLAQMPDDIEERTLAVFGFPVENGVLRMGPGQRVLPTRMESRATSGSLTLPRFDTGAPADFLALENAPIGAFGGAPVFLMPAGSAKGGAVARRDTGRCVGLVHGTMGDETGGKLAAVVPARDIVDVLSKAVDVLGLRRFVNA